MRQIATGYSDQVMSPLILKLMISVTIIAHNKIRKDLPGKFPLRRGHPPVIQQWLLKRKVVGDFISVYRLSA
jgi:hypothetical protein